MTLAFSNFLDEGVDGFKLAGPFFNLILGRLTLLDEEDICLMMTSVLDSVSRAIFFGLT